MLQADEVFQFKGKEEPAKEFDCVLIYNEEDGVRFTLLYYLKSLNLRIHWVVPDVHVREAGLVSNALV